MSETCKCGCGQEPREGKRFVHGHNSTRPILDRLMSKVVWNGDEDECWEWAGALNNHGYGQIGHEGLRQLSHRVSYGLFVGPIPAGLVLDHLCRNPRCVNPAHLEPVTHRENLMRGNVRSNGAKNRAKTHCPKGHPYGGDNLFVRRSGKRECRECMRASNRKSYRKAAQA